MHLPSLIEQKREGHALSAEQIQHIITQFTSGALPDYQMSALAMAIYFQGMNAEETSALTQAMLHSGSTLQWPASAPQRVDKHSTGGIGDKSSLVLAPLLACAGAWVPMISGRGLGITGGTLDKLESIPGFRVGLSEEEMSAVLQEVGCAMIGQTASICPADKKLYALRDVTATVPSIPLIVASIMGKKLAEGLNRLVLDVKYGSGAFMKTRAEAQKLADAMVSAGEALGVRTRALLHPMDEPCGHAVGNALEVIECVACLQGHGPPDLEMLVLDLAQQVVDTPRSQLAEWLRDGTAWLRFQRMVTAQGGRAEDLERLHLIHAAPVIQEMKAEQGGTVQRVDAECIGRASLLLGAGRATASDAVDHAVGMDRIVKVGQQVNVGETLLRIHARSDSAAQEAAQSLSHAIVIAV